MAEIAAAVTDTHALLFHAAGGQRLGKAARAIFAAAEEREALIYVPAAVIWEVALLARGGRIHLTQPVPAFFTDLFSNPSYQVHALDTGQVFAAAQATVFPDPFDGLICAAALDLSLPLITRDTVIATAGVVKILW